ncbi:MAG TPA: hypothetical protein DEB06_10820 [Phycisphaerales bacterium]|nr:hypothetical protein [Phycisphaerales bacterium]
MLGAAQAILALVFVTGCATTPPPGLPPELPPGLPPGLPTTPASALVLGEASPPASPLTLRDAYPFVALGEREPVAGAERPGSDGALVSRWEVLDRSLEGREVREVREERTTSGPGQWRVRTIIDGHTEAIEERTIRLDPARDGLVLAESLQHERGVRVVMTPPPLAMPSDLAPGAPFVQTMGLRMPLLENPRRIRAQGTGDMTLEHDADQPLTLDGRVIRCRRLREVFVTAVPPARAVRTTERWFAPGLGLVAERWREEVRVLGVVTERTERTIRLIPAP